MYVPKEILENFCKSNHIAKLSFYGSWVSDPESSNDIDILIEFEESVKPGLLLMARLERELSEIFNKKVDLRTPEELSKFSRKQVINEARIEYQSKR